jgi:hypothetical protein
MELLCSNVRPSHLDEVTCAIVAVDDMICMYRFPSVDPEDIVVTPNTKLTSFYILSFVCTLKNLVRRVVSILYKLIPEQVRAIVREQLTTVVHRLTTDIIVYNTESSDDPTKSLTPNEMETDLGAICDLHFKHFLQWWLDMTNAIQSSMLYCLARPQPSNESVDIPANKYNPVSAFDMLSAPNKVDSKAYRMDWFSK